MQDYDVIYRGMVIGNIKADNDKEALEIAQKQYSGIITVEKSN